MRTVNLDVALLRTFVLTHQLGSLNQAANVVGRTQSAVSQQISRLEESLGKQLFQRQGRRIALTEDGMLVLRYAQRMIALNDELVSVTEDSDPDAEIRLGMSADFSIDILHALMREFRDDYPTLRLSISSDRHSVISEKLSNGAMDLGLMFGFNKGEAAETLGRVQQVWVGHQSVVDLPGPIPLVVFEEPCGFRRTALQALADAGIASRIAVTCSSLPALWLAVQAGCGIALRTAIGAPKSLLLDAAACNLPVLPEIDLRLHRTPHGLTKNADLLRQCILAGLPARIEALVADGSHTTRHSRHAPAQLA